MASTKRKHDVEGTLYSNKSRSRPSAEAKVDPTYGQKSAIPGLDEETIVEGEDSDLNYDDEMDALAYLRAVRHEATGIPNLLVAPRDNNDVDARDIYNGSGGDLRGRYHDGAYVAESHSGEESEEEVEQSQKACYDWILSRYEGTRTILSQPPPPELVNGLDIDHPVHVNKLHRRLAQWWVRNLKSSHPLPVQIASMDKTTVLRLLGLVCQGTLLKRGLEIHICLSQWILSLLARLPERGYLTSEEIGIVRELGKKAVLVSMSLKERNDWSAGIREVEAGMDDDFEEYEELEASNEDDIELDDEEQIYVDRNSTTEALNHVEVADDEDTSLNSLPQSADKIEQDMVPVSQDTNHAEPSSHEDIETIKARLLKRVQPEVDQAADPEPSESLLQCDPTKPNTPDKFAKWNTQATIDMILTVAGEAYGQRDLLEFRGNWYVTL